MGQAGLPKPWVEQTVIQVYKELCLSNHSLTVHRSMASPTPRERFFKALHQATLEGDLSKLTLGKYRGTDKSVKNLFIRPVQLKAGPHLCFLWRHQTKDITKNLLVPAALAEIDRLVGTDFHDAHLFTARETGQLETQADGSCRVKIKPIAAPAAAVVSHDRSKSRPIDPASGWLHTLGVTNEQGHPRTGQTPKFRQIQKFAEVIQHLLTESGLDSRPDHPPLRIADMGSGKGYLTFATAQLLPEQAHVWGIERRADLVDTCNRAAQTHGLKNLTFRHGDITPQAPDIGELDVLIALHACDTATDDALAAGIAAGASLFVVSPCCQKELRPQLLAPSVLAPALRHGILHERHAEFVTDSLRALLLESLGFTTKVFEFVSTEHTAKNLMLVAYAPPQQPRTASPAALRRTREFAQFYGIKSQTLARHLGIDLATS